MRYDSDALPNPYGGGSEICDVFGDSRADDCAHTNRFGDDDRVVARRAEMSCGEFVACSTCHPVQRRENKRRTEG